MGRVPVKTICCDTTRCANKYLTVVTHNMANTLVFKWPHRTQKGQVWGRISLFAYANHVVSELVHVFYR